MFDGLLRPLLDQPEWLVPGALTTGTGKWLVEPRVRRDEVVAFGAVLADATGAEGVARVVPTPAGIAGAVTWVATAGSYGPDDPIAVVPAARPAGGVVEGASAAGSA